MTEPDLTPVEPYPGFHGAGTAEPTPSRPPALAITPEPEIRPAEPSSWSKTVPLDHPLVVDGRRLDAITIRRATGSDIADLLEEDPDELTLPMRLRASICGVHPAIFRALSADDSERLAEAVTPFLPRAVLDIEAALAPAVPND